MREHISGHNQSRQHLNFLAFKSTVILDFLIPIMCQAFMVTLTVPKMYTHML